jgi:hypothetical protein
MTTDIVRANGQNGLLSGLTRTPVVWVGVLGDGDHRVDPRSGFKERDTPFRATAIEFETEPGADEKTAEAETPPPPLRRIQLPLMIRAPAVVKRRCSQIRSWPVPFGPAAPATNKARSLIVSMTLQSQSS